MTQISDAIVGGLAPLLGNRPKRVTFEYAPGQTIVLKGHALLTWWTELSRMYLLFKQMTMNDGPVFSSEQIQEQFEEGEEDDDE